MAAIDKLYVKHFFQFDDLRIWALIHKLSLFNNLINPFDTSYQDWEQRKEDAYNNQKEIVNNFFTTYPTLSDYQDAYKNYMTDIEAKHDWNNMVALKEKLEDEWEYKDNISFPIARFTLKQDRWLFWHCPLDFIREYLIEQCGYKEKWYHKILFKFTMKPNFY